MEKTGILTMAGLVLAGVCAFAQPAPDFETVMKKSLDGFAALKDYSATTRKKELVGRNKYKEQWDIKFKFMKPFSIYARIGEGEGKGTEIIYSKGRYDDKLVVHKPGALGLFNIRLDPLSPLATKGERHPVGESYMGYTIQLLRKNHDEMKKKAKGEIKFVSEAAVDGRKTWRYKASFPPGEGFYAAVIVIDFDQATSLPVKIQCFGWDGTLWEDYVFTGLKVNTGLTAKDFDYLNPAYGFKKK